MGCNQSQHKNDSDTDSCSDEISPYERTPFNSNSSSRPSSTPYLSSKASSNLNNVNNDLHKMYITKNGTLSPKASKKQSIKFPNLPSSSSTSPTSNNNENEKDIPSTTSNNKYPQNPVPDKLTINDRLRNITSDEHKQHSFKYRTKKVTIYKPKLQTPSIQNTQHIDNNNNDNISRSKYHSHSRQKSKDDMTLHFNLNRRRTTKPRSNNKLYRSRYNQIDQRLPTIKDSETRSFGIGIGIHRKQDIYSYHMAAQYDTECVTDIDGDSETDDNHTIIQHDSSNNYDSDDSYWDAMYLQNKKRDTDRPKHGGNKSRKNTHSYLTHRRQGTYHAYGGDDDDDDDENHSKTSDSESGIGINYIDDINDELSDDSLNRMTKMATGYNEDHPLANSSDDNDDDDDDTTDDETAMFDVQQHGMDLHQDTPTMLVHDVSRGTSVADIDSDTTEDMQSGFNRHTIGAGPDPDAELHDIQITKPRYNTSQLSASITGNSDTDSIASKSVISCIDKSSISIHQIDKAAFLQKIFLNSINKQKVQKQQQEMALERERIKKEKELKLQEAHRTSNIVVIDDNTIAINIGITPSIIPSIIPEGDEENIINSDDEHYENPSQDDDQQSDTDTDPETAMLDFHDHNDEMFNLIINKDLENMDRNIQHFKIVVDGVAIYNDVNLIEEIFNIQLKNGDIVKGKYIDSNIILLTKWKLYVSSMDTMELKQDKNDDIYIPPPPQPIIVEPTPNNNNNDDKLQQIINKINSTDIATPVIVTEINHTEDATMIINEETIDEISLHHISSNPVSPESITDDIKMRENTISPRTESSNDELKSIQNTSLKHDEFEDIIESISNEPDTPSIESKSIENDQQKQQETTTELIEVQPLKSDSDTDSTQNTPEPQTEPECEPESEPKYIEDNPPKSEPETIESIQNTPSKSKINAIASKLADLNINPAALKPGAIPKRKQISRPRAQTTGDIDRRPKFEPIIIGKGRRKKRSKRKKVNVSSPKTDDIAPQLFCNRNQESLPSEHPALSSQGSLVERYKAQLLENKDEILKLIETHKENKKNRPDSPTFDDDMDDEKTPLKPTEIENNDIGKLKMKERAESPKQDIEKYKYDILKTLNGNKNNAKHIPLGDNNISLDSQLIEACSHDISKLINSGKSNPSKTPKKRGKTTKHKNGIKSPKMSDLDKKTIIKYKDDIKKIMKQNKKAQNVAFRPRAESAVKPPKKSNKKKLKPKPIQTRPVYFDKMRQDIVTKRKKGKYKPRTARSSANNIKKRRNLHKTECKMTKSHSASPKQRKKVKPRSVTPSPKQRKTATEPTIKKQVIKPRSSCSEKPPIKRVQSSPQNQMKPDLPTPRAPEILYESKSASPITTNIVTNNGNVIKPRISLKDRMAIYQETSAGIGITAQERLNKIKADRRTSDSNVSLNEEQRETATNLLKQYATKKAAHIADITLIDKTMKNITKQNCIEKLEILGIITYIYVPINQFDRWNNRNCIANIIDSGHDNQDKYRKHPKKYIKMTNITLLNSKVLIKLAEEQKELFKTLILYGIERCKRIYKINFNAANITNPFLDKILNIMSLRNDTINKQQISLRDGDESNNIWFNRLNNDKDMMYGPELFLAENNPISDRGIKMVCKYVKGNGLHLKCLKVGHCFGTISTNLCGIFCQSLLENEYILKVTFDMRWSQHRQSVDKALKRNYTKYRNQQKLYKQSLIIPDPTKSN